MDTRSYQQIFPSGSPARLVVENIRGSVIIRPTLEKQITVQANVNTQSGKVEHTLVEITQGSDQTVYAVTKINNTGFLPGKTAFPCKVDYTIEIPADCDIKLNNVSSSALLEGLSGHFDIDMVSGNLGLTDVSGTFELKTVSGNLTALRLAGGLELSTVSGDVRMQNCQVEHIKAKTVSGNLTFDSPLKGGPFHFNSVSGDIHLIVPADTSCEITMNTLSGDAYVGLSATYHHYSRKTRRITVQDGGAEVYIHTLSGDLNIVTTEQMKHPAPDQPPQPAGKPGPDPMEVLDRIGRGEISVEEGINIIQNPAG
jgi:hypothetical protein